MIGAESSIDDFSTARRVLGWLDLDMIPFNNSLVLPDPIPQGKNPKKASRKGLLFHQDMDWNERIHPTINDYYFLGAWINACLDDAKKKAERASQGASPEGNKKKPAGSPLTAGWVAHFNAPLENSLPAAPSQDSGSPKPAA